MASATIRTTWRRCAPRKFATGLRQGILALRNWSVAKHPARYARRTSAYWFVAAGEAALVRDALTQLAIPSVYLSNRDSVFETLEAQELLWVLQAVMTPERENTLRSALATSMMGMNAQDLDALNNDENAGCGSRRVRWLSSDLA